MQPASATNKSLSRDGVHISEISDIALMPPRGVARMKYPFHKLSVGQYFTADHPRVRAAATQYGRRHGVHFSTRTVEGVVQVWRVR
jgi:hypothetical protein